MADIERDPDSLSADPDPDVDSSDAGTPLDTPTPVEGQNPMDFHSNGDDKSKRLPSLRSVSDSQAPSGHPMSASSTHLGLLSNARRPAAGAGAGASIPTAAMGAGRLPEDLNAKMRAFALSRARGGGPGSSPSPASPTGSGPSPASPGGPIAGIPIAGMPSKNSPLSRGIQRPGAPSFPQSAPTTSQIKPAGGLAGRRKGPGLKLGDMGQGPAESASASSTSNPAGPPNGNAHVSQMKQFEQYIDAEKGYLTFKDKAVITDKGVDFSDGTVFRISLDEVEKMDELGKGNYGTVYKVRHTKPLVPRFGPGLSAAKPPSLPGLGDSSTAPVVDGKGGSNSGIVMAMKEMRLELDEAKLATIIKELLILHECASPYIIDFYGAFFQESAVYICIEYMDGGSIDKLYSGGIPENVLRKITYCTIMGLKELKEKHNIIHRDVKPTNILVNSQGRVKICDFGVSGNLVASIAKTNIGCQSYMAPERISGGTFMQSGASDGTYSVQSDIWSLGLTIIECALGKYPYPPEISSTIFSQLSAIVEGEPPGLPDEGYSSTASTFVTGCLNKVPKLRPSYADLLASEWLKGLAMPETISEEDEESNENDASDEAVSRAAGKLDHSHSKPEDPEVAAWVQSVMEKKASGQYGQADKKPALHAAPLDAAVTSPLASPDIAR